jgi:hypothetical protein
MRISMDIERLTQKHLESLHWGFYSKLGVYQKKKLKAYFTIYLGVLFKADM